jgi:hypothetical protein
MKQKITYCLFAITLLLFGTACRKNECSASEKAVIRDYTGLDGCGFVIELMDGTVLEPVNLEDFSLPLFDGKPIWIRYHETVGGSICMVGTIVQIDCMEER